MFFPYFCRPNILSSISLLSLPLSFKNSLNFPCGKTTERVKSSQLSPIMSSQHFLTSLGPSPMRSEEHTSELQSRQYLVCRLLLEKKNIFTSIYPLPRMPISFSDTIVSPYFTSLISFLLILPLTPSTRHYPHSYLFITSSPTSLSP